MYNLHLLTQNRDWKIAFDLVEQYHLHWRNQQRQVKFE